MKVSSYAQFERRYGRDNTMRLINGMTKYMRACRFGDEAEIAAAHEEYYKLRLRILSKPVKKAPGK